MIRCKCVIYQGGKLRLGPLALRGADGDEQLIVRPKTIANDYASDSGEAENDCSVKPRTSRTIDRPIKNDCAAKPRTTPR